MPMGVPLGHESFFRKKVVRRSPSGQRREVQGLIPQGFGSSNLPLRIILPVILYVTLHLYGVGCERRVCMGVEVKALVEAAKICILAVDDTVVIFHNETSTGNTIY